MSKLEYEVVTYFKVDYHDLEDFVCKAYGLDEWSVVADQEEGNDTSVTVSATKNSLSKYDRDRLGKFLSGNDPGWMLHVLMNDMADRDLIPEGSYLVRISW